MKRRWLPLALGAVLLTGPALLAQEELLSLTPTTKSLVVRGIV
jgi:hypothetical protein